MGRSNITPIIQEGLFQIGWPQEAITDKLERCRYYIYCTKRILFKWLNRKSQRKAYTWETFEQALIHVGWPTPRISKDLNPFRREEACWMLHRGAGCMGNPLVRFREGQEYDYDYGWDTVAPPWKQAETEKTNFDRNYSPPYRKNSTNYPTFIVFSWEG